MWVLDIYKQQFSKFLPFPFSPILSILCPFITAVILILISLPTALGWLCSGSRAAPFLLPGSILLDVSGGHTALQDGSPGLQHQL